MFNTIFAADIPLAIRLLLAFLVVLGVIGGAVWAMRQLGSGRLPGADPHGRWPRLAVVDIVGLGRHSLVLVRRDEVEHLLLIDGQTATVVESNIVHAPSTPHVPVAHLPGAPAPLPRFLLRRDEGSEPLPPRESGRRRLLSYRPRNQQPRNRMPGT